MHVHVEGAGKKEERKGDVHRGGESTGNDPPRDDRLHNDPPGIVRKLIADKIERSQNGIKRKPLIARERFLGRRFTRKLIRPIVTIIIRRCNRFNPRPQIPWNNFPPSPGFVSHENSSRT